MNAIGDTRPYHTVLRIETNAGPNSINGFYCLYECGAIVVACCAHIANVL